ncbi:MAG: serine/threonine protein kinase [Planctomycetaceae bacterium]|nr:serine/threonine protein kinase [Planctomycetaceae bacterium]
MKLHLCLELPTLQSLLDQSLPAKETFACESHLEVCPRCRKRLEELAGEAPWWQETVSVLAETGAMAATPLDFGSTSDWSPASEVASKSVMLSQVRQLLDAPVHPEMLGRLAGYDIESLLGQGGFGVVFRAFDRELNRPVAIKVLAPHLATVGTARRRFVREAQAAAAVTHPNVVPIHAVSTDSAYPFLVMSYVPGRSLQEQVRQNGPLEPKAIARIGQQVAAGLAAAHRQGLVHRDIKPANILLENGLDRALITDFGLARASDDAISQTGWLAGTPHYMSPEQASSGELDGRSDLFSLGCVLYFMATGREPFRGTQPLAILNQIANQKPSPVRSVNSDIPQVLAQVIERLLEKKPADRFQSAAELSDFLEQYLAYLHQPEIRRQPQVPRKASATKLASILWLGSAVMVLSAVGVFATSLWTSGNSSRSDGSRILDSGSKLDRFVPFNRDSKSDPLPQSRESHRALLADSDRDRQQLEHGLTQLDRDLTSIEQHWRVNSPTEFDVNRGWQSEDLSEQFLKLQRSVRELEMEAANEKF